MPETDKRRLLDDLTFFEEFAQEAEERSSFWDSKEATQFEKTVKGEGFVVQMAGTEIANKIRSIAATWRDAVQQLKLDFFPEECATPHAIAALQAVGVSWDSALSASSWRDVPFPVSALILVGESAWEPYDVPVGRYREVFRYDNGLPLILTPHGLVMMLSE